MSSQDRSRVVSTWLANVCWLVAGVGLYGICIDVFGGYPQVHSEALDWAAVVLIVVAGALAWFWHERHDPQ
jgi:hypothetical protein